MSKNLSMHERHMEGLLAKHVKENAGVLKGINICMDAALKIRKAGEDLLDIYGKSAQIGLYNATVIEQKVRLSINTIQHQIKLMKVTWGSNDVGFIRKLRELLKHLEEAQDITQKIEHAKRIIETAAATYERLKTFLSTDQLIEREMQSLGTQEDKIRREMGNWLG